MTQTLKQILAKLKPGQMYLSPDKKFLYVSIGPMRVEPFQDDFSNWTEEELETFAKEQTRS